jgi:hypothetical protein
MYFTIGVIGIINFHSSENYALIMNTWNDFPEDYHYNGDSFPGQALQAYFVLKEKGYNDDKIFLLVYHSGDNFIDFDYDFNNDLNNAVIDVDNEEVNKTRFIHVLDYLSNIITVKDNFLIYLTGHGKYDEKGISSISFENGDLITQVELGSLLDKIMCNKMIILLDFCYSGDFNVTLNKPGRTLITASANNVKSWFYWDWGRYLSPDNKRIFGDSGSAFFHPFWLKWNENTSIEDAYLYGNEQHVKWVDIFEESRDIIEVQKPQFFIKKRSFLDKFIFFYPGGQLFAFLGAFLIVCIILYLVVIERAMKV